VILASYHKSGCKWARTVHDATTCAHLNRVCGRPRVVFVGRQSRLTVSRLSSLNSFSFPCSLRNRWVATIHGSRLEHDDGCAGEYVQNWKELRA
jgi:hypothetical protein